MKILRLQDAGFKLTDIPYTYWTWNVGNVKLEFNSLPHFACLKLNNNTIWNKHIDILNPLVTYKPDDVWAEITATLFEHDIICEPIEVVKSLELPEMEFPLK